MTPYRRYNNLSSKGGSDESAASRPAGKRRWKLSAFELQCILCSVVLLGVLVIKMLGGTAYLKTQEIFDGLFGQSQSSSLSQPSPEIGSLTPTQAAVSVPDSQSVSSQLPAVTEQEIEDTVAYMKSLLPAGMQVDDATLAEYARQYLENRAAEAQDAVVSESTVSMSGMSTGKYPPLDSNMGIDEILQLMSDVSASGGGGLALTEQLETVTQDGDLVPTALLTDTDLKKTKTFAQKAEGGLLAAPEGTSFAPFFPDLEFQNPLKTDFRISSKFGYRYHPVTGMFGFHTGVDLPAPSGTYIYAVAAGKITDCGYSDVWGNYILITHDDHTETFYAHCKTLLRKKGTTVKKGQTIARVGSTGLSTGAHLHYEVCIDGVRMDPAWVLSM